MKRTPFLPLAALLALLSAGLPGHAALDRAESIRLAASVLRIEAPRERGGFALGSAVVVAPEQVVTNCHVTREARTINVVRGGVRWAADAQVSDAERDLCLLRVPGLRAAAVPLGGATSLAVGRSVTAFGYTGGAGLQHSDGEVVGLHPHDGGQVIQSSNWFSSGASGGGLFDDDGTLVGILTFRLRGAGANAFAAPGEWVRQLLEAGAAGAWRDVMPLPASPPTYWEAGASERPPFLRAAQRQHDERCADLDAAALERPRGESSGAEAVHCVLHPH